MLTALVLASGSTVQNLDIDKLVSQHYSKTQSTHPSGGKLPERCAGTPPAGDRPSLGQTSTQYSAPFASSAGTRNHWWLARKGGMGMPRRFPAEVPWVSPPAEAPRALLRVGAVRLPTPEASTVLKGDVLLPVRLLQEMGLASLIKARGILQQAAPASQWGRVHSRSERACSHGVKVLVQYFNPDSETWYSVTGALLQP